MGIFALGWVVATVLLLLLIQRGLQVASLEAQVQRLQAQLARVQGGVPAGTELSAAAAAGTSSGMASADWQADVRRLVVEGRKIEAIKLYRERTGLGLKDAKDAVDALSGG